jgi:hypothetical protein
MASSARERHSDPYTEKHKIRKVTKMFGIPKTPEALAAAIATIPGTSDIRVEGDCVHYLYTPPYTLSWINLDPGLRLDERPEKGSIRA